MHACGGTNNCVTAIQRFSELRNDQPVGHRDVGAIIPSTGSRLQGHRLNFFEAIIHCPKTRGIEDHGVDRQQLDPWQEPK